MLVVGHGAATGGFARVVHSLIEHLAGDYEFHHFAVNHRVAGVEGAWPIYGNPDPLDALSLDRMDQLIGDLRPDLVLMLHDLWFCSVHGSRFGRTRGLPRTIAYCPVDGVLTRPSLYQSLAGFDWLVAYTRFGQGQLARVLREAGVGLERLAVIAHGVDRDRFSPVAATDLLDRVEAKRERFGPGREQDFVVLNAAKHDGRKRLDLTIRGFARFATGKPDTVKLYLHTAARFEGMDLRDMAWRAGVAERLITTPGWLVRHPDVDDRQLNLIYQASDVGINTSAGEGWGLVSVEHAATGAPQVVPAHTACREIWEGLETLVPVRSKAEHRGLGMQREFVHEEDVAAVLERLYHDLDFRAEQARRARDIAGRPGYAWSAVAAEWDGLFQTALHQRRESSSSVRARPYAQ